MIISVSRRTDVPAFYSEWFQNRLRAGFVRVQNPFNSAQVRRVSLEPEAVDCFVFWTKNPKPMLELGLPEELDRLGYPYYFQFTITPYGPELEPNLPPKEWLADTFVELARRIGRERMVWRYDPIVLAGELDPAWHREAFRRLCRRLGDSVDEVVISFVDPYARVRSPWVRKILPERMVETARGLADVAWEYGLAVRACCEPEFLAETGVGSAMCIDPERIGRITGRAVAIPRDRSQRPGCRCAQSVDIGVYNTCAHGCVYCYASHSAASVARNRARHDPLGESLLPLADTPRASTSANPL